MPLVDQIDAIDGMLSGGKPLAAIRIPLQSLREQAEALESRLSALEAHPQDDVLRAENERLRVNLKEAFDEMENLRAAAKEQKERAAYDREMEQRATHEPELPEAQLAMLQFVASHPGYNHYGIAQDLGIGEEVAMFHLEELRSADLVERRGRAEHRWEFHPTQRGRRFLTKRGLLQ